MRPPECCQRPRRWHPASPAGPCQPGQAIDFECHWAKSVGPPDRLTVRPVRRNRPPHARCSTQRASPVWARYSRQHRQLVQAHRWTLTRSSDWLRYFASSSFPPGAQPPVHPPCRNHNRDWRASLPHSSSARRCRSIAWTRPRPCAQTPRVSAAHRGSQDSGWLAASRRSRRTRSVRRN
ncbi:hypothetical protein D3C86_1711490 [compost metagenome]